VVGEVPTTKPVWLAEVVVAQVNLFQVQVGLPMEAIRLPGGLLVLALFLQVLAVAVPLKRGSIQQRIKLVVMVGKDCNCLPLTQIFLL
jgi:hypothetical protein